MFVRFEADVIAKPCLPYFIALDRDTSSVGTDVSPRGKMVGYLSHHASLLSVLTPSSSMRKQCVMNADAVASRCRPHCMDNDVAPSLILTALASIVYCLRINSTLPCIGGQAG